MKFFTDIDDGNAAAKKREAAVSSSSSSSSSSSGRFRAIFVMNLMLIVIGTAMIFYDRDLLHQTTTGTMLDWDGDSSYLKAAATTTKNDGYGGDEGEREDDDDDVDENDDPRPWLILHIGPPKSATTTIQHGLGVHAKKLAEEDNFWYLGQFRFDRDTKLLDLGDAKDTIFRLDQFESREMHAALRDHREKGHNVILSAEQYTSREFSWKRLYERKFLKDYRKNNNSINNTSATAARSDDDDDGEDDDEGEGDGHVDNVEPSFGFRVKVVVAYRHFFEWMPSLYHQTYIYLPSDPDNANSYDVPGIVEYAGSFLDSLVGYDPNKNDKSNTIETTSRLEHPSEKAGIGLQRMNYTKHGIEPQTSHGSVWAYLKFTDKPELRERVDVLDLHQQTREGSSVSGADNGGSLDDEPSSTAEDSSSSSGGRREGKKGLGRGYKRGGTDVFADFVCQSLPTASNTCESLRNRPEVLQMRTSETPKFLSSIDAHRIISRARSLFSSLPSSSSLDRKNLLWDHGGQMKVERKIDKWFRKTKKMNALTDTPESRALMVCADDELLDRLRKASWNFLVQMVELSRSHAASRKRKDDRYYRSLFRSTTPTDHLLLSSQVFFFDDDDSEEEDDDSSWKGPAKASHDASFDAHVVGKRKLCQLNVTMLFEDESFIRSVFGH